MAISKYQKKRVDTLKKEAVLLYKKGLSLRKVGRILGKSHQWVADAIEGKVIR